MNYSYTGDKPDHISATQIDVGQCLFKYMRSRLMGESTESAPMREGKFVHEFIYHYTKVCVAERTPADMGEFETIYNALFSAFKLPENIYQDTRDKLMVWAERGIEFDRYLDAEERHSVQFAPGRILEMVFDRTNSYSNDMGSILEIIDYKHMFKLMSNEDIKKSIQLKLYKYGACCHVYENYDYVRVGIYNTRHNIMRWGDLEYIPDLSNEFEGTETFLNRQWDRLIENNEYPPAECDQCWAWGGCQYMDDTCPLYSLERIEKMKVGNVEEQIRAARKMDIELKALKKAIQKELEVLPAVEVDGKTTGYSVTPSYKYDLQDLLKYFKKYGITDFDIDIGKKDAEKNIEHYRGHISKMLPEEFEDLKRARVETASSRFSI